MKIIAILLFLTMSLIGYGNDVANVSQKQKSNLTETSDTVCYKFQQDTISLADTPQVSQIIYAEHESKIDIWMGYLFPIIMLLLGVGIDRFIVHLSDKKRITKIGKRWIAELKSLESPIKTQQDNFNEFIVNYCNNEDEFKIPDMKFYSSINGEKFESLGKEDLYEYLEVRLKEEATEDFNKITSIVSILKATYDQLTKVINDFKAESSSYINNYNSNLRKYVNDVKEIESQTPMLGMSKVDYDTLIKLFQDEIDSKMPDINIFKTKDSFIKPSLTIIDKYNAKNLMSLRSSLMGCLDNILGLRNEKRYIKDNLRQIIKAYTNVDEILKLVLSDLRRKN